jgi:hypothetical protein
MYLKFLIVGHEEEEENKNLDAQILRFRSLLPLTPLDLGRARKFSLRPVNPVRWPELATATKRRAASEPLTFFVRQRSFILSFQTLLGEPSHGFLGVHDLPEYTYCIIDRIHFGTLP